VRLPSRSILISRTDDFEPGIALHQKETPSATIEFLFEAIGLEADLYVSGRSISLTLYDLGEITAKDIVKDFGSFIARYKTALDSFSSAYRTSAITNTQVVVHQLKSFVTRIGERSIGLSLSSCS
jgi:hypothetical protein